MLKAKRVILPTIIFFFLTLSLPNVANSEESVTLLFVGDLMGHDSQIASAEVEENAIYDYEPSFMYVKPIIKKADLAIGNLEVTLPGMPPYTGFPRFRSPDAYGIAIKDAGFDLVSTSNNHCNDSGPEGLVQTLELLDTLHILHTGTFRSSFERQENTPLIVNLKGFKLAFLNYTYGTNKIETVPPTIVNLIDEELIASDIQAAKEYDPDAIIVLMHWGREYSIIENAFQSRLAQKLFDWGASLVIGTHPHVLQPIRETKVNSEKKVVAYSLGNFISGQTRPNTDRSIIFEVELKKRKGSQKAYIASHRYIPVWRYIKKESEGKLTYMTIPISPFEKKIPKYLGMTREDKKHFRQSAKWIRKHLKQFDSAERKVTLKELSE